jgi:hypothetical protein
MMRPGGIQRRVLSGIQPTHGEGLRRSPEGQAAGGMSGEDGAQASYPTPALRHAAQDPPRSETNFPGLGGQVHSSSPCLTTACRDE